MKAGQLVFRFRFVALIFVFVLGFSVPWDRGIVVLSDWDGGRTVWLTLAAAMTRNGWASFSGSTIAVLVLGIVCAVLGAWLRTWGAAYLGGGVVQDAALHGAAVVADGPYRYVRNPLYLGTSAHTLALALLMPPSGAVFTVLAVTAIEAMLIAGEEQFLAESLGTLYAAYKAQVPRLLPSLRAKAAAGGLRPRWEQAVLSEIYMWGVAGSFAVAGWKYNSFLLIKCVVVSFGVSLVVRALAPKESPLTQTNG